MQHQLTKSRSMQPKKATSQSEDDFKSVKIIEINDFM